MAYSEETKKLQEYLKSKGANIVVDGYMGAETKAAQEKYGTPPASESVSKAKGQTSVIENLAKNPDSPEIVEEPKQPEQSEESETLKNANDLIDATNKSEEARAKLDEAKKQQDKMSKTLDDMDSIPIENFKNPKMKALFMQNNPNMNYDEVVEISKKRREIIKEAKKQAWGTPISEKNKIEAEKLGIPDLSKYQNSLLNLNSMTNNATKEAAKPKNKVNPVADVLMKSLYATGKSSAGGDWNPFKGSAEAVDKQEEIRLKELESQSNKRQMTPKKVEVDANGIPTLGGGYEAYATDDEIILAKAGGTPLVARTPNEVTRHGDIVDQSTNAYKEKQDYKLEKADLFAAKDEYWDKRLIDYRNAGELILAGKKDAISQFSKIDDDIVDQKNIVENFAPVSTKSRELSKISTQLNDMGISGYIDMSIADIKNNFGVDSPESKLIAQYNSTISQLTSYAAKVVKGEVGNLSIWEQKLAQRMLGIKTLPYETRQQLINDFADVVDSRRQYASMKLNDMYELKFKYAKQAETGKLDNSISSTKKEPPLPAGATKGMKYNGKDKKLKDYTLQLVNGSWGWAK